jgi:hypothetical protein
MSADGVALRIVEVGIAGSALPPAEEPTRPLASATSAMNISRAASAVQRLAN